MSRNSALTWVVGSLWDQRHGEIFTRLETRFHTAELRARTLDDPRLLAAILQRCAFVYRPDEIARARPRFAESVALFRSLGRDDETARALAYWADAEIVSGELQTGASIARDALELAPEDIRMFLMNGLATCYLGLGDRARAGPAAREALTLAARAGHPVATACAILYLAALECTVDAENAARLLGYAEERLRALDWRLVGPDDAIREGARGRLEQQLAPDQFADLLAAGAAWSEEAAIANAARF